MLFLKIALIACFTLCMPGCSDSDDQAPIPVPIEPIPRPTPNPVPATQPDSSTSVEISTGAYINQNSTTPLKMLIIRESEPGTIHESLLISDGDDASYTLLHIPGYTLAEKFTRLQMNGMPFGIKDGDITRIDLNPIDEKSINFNITKSQNADEGLDMSGTLVMASPEEIKTFFAQLSETKGNRVQLKEEFLGFEAENIVQLALVPENNSTCSSYFLINCQDLQGVGFFTEGNEPEPSGVETVTAETAPEEPAPPLPPNVLTNENSDFLNKFNSKKHDFDHLWNPEGLGHVGRFKGYLFSETQEYYLVPECIIPLSNEDVEKLRADVGIWAVWPESYKSIEVKLPTVTIRADDFNSDFEESKLTMGEENFLIEISGFFDTETRELKESFLVTSTAPDHISDMIRNLKFCEGG